MKRQEGFVLIEMVLAVFILGIVAASYFTAQATAFKGSYYIKEKSNALTIAQSENLSGDEQYPGIIGYVHKQPYNAAPWWFGVTTSNVSTSPGLSFTPAVLAAGYAGFTVNVTASALEGFNSDIQKITVVIAHSRPEGTVDVVSYLGYSTNITRS